MKWIRIGWPKEKRVVLVWLKDRALPFCGYMKFAAGDKSCPYWVVYHGNTDISADVVAWCDCLPDEPPPAEHLEQFGALAGDVYKHMMEPER